jgi:hypothetical protein
LFLYSLTVRAIQAKKRRPAKKARGQNQNQQNSQQPQPQTPQPPAQQVQSPTQLQAPPPAPGKQQNNPQNSAKTQNHKGKGKNKGAAAAAAAKPPQQVPGPPVVKETPVLGGVQLQHALNDVLDHVLDEDEDLRLQSCPDFLHHSLAMQQQ